MNTTVRTRRSGPGSAALREPAPGKARSASGTKAPGRPARPAPLPPGPQAPGRPEGPARSRPARPATRRPARPATRRPSRPATAAGTSGAKVPAAARRHASRTPFILLVIGLLAGGLVCLLVINTTLAAGSVQIGRLQQDNTAASQQLQQLQQQVTAEQSPAWIQQRALDLGLQPQPVLNFVDLPAGRRYSTAATLPSLYNVPGYTP
jgi:hypothetical protein